jgi:hypothetical protein
VFNCEQPPCLVAITLSGMPKAKANDHVHRVNYLRRLCSSVDKMHNQTVRLVSELTPSPRVAKSAAIRIKRLEGRASTLRRR